MDEFINIAKDFSTKLGGRCEGQFSGERFYNEILKPKFIQASNTNTRLIINLDGVRGYGSSFLDQSFGELAREFGLENVKSILTFKTFLFQWYVDYIHNEIWGR